MNGVISKLSSFDFNGKKLYSFQLKGINGFFRTGENPIPAMEGEFVEFDAKGPDAKGNYQVQNGSIVVKKDSNPQKGLKSFRKVVDSAPTSKDDYWERKEVRDVETQKRIETQSCRNSALQFIDILIKTEAVKVPAKNKVEFFEELLEHYMSEFQQRNSGVADAKAPESMAKLETSDSAEPSVF